MTNKKWTLFSNHGHVLAFVAEHPQATTQFIAQSGGLSIRAVQNILQDLEEDGYLTKAKVGRNNLYRVNPEKPLRHRLERHHNVSSLLQALGIEFSASTLSKD
jgi:DNA-binding transcriptional ArsR family regulator